MTTPTKTSLAGHLATGDSDLAVAVLKSWLGDAHLRARPRLAGFEITHEGPDAYLYAYLAHDSKSHLMEGWLAGAPEAARARLERLADIAEAHGLAGDMDYQGLDTNEESVGDERSLFWPRGV